MLEIKVVIEAGESWREVLKTVLQAATSVPVAEPRAAEPRAAEPEAAKPARTRSRRTAQAEPVAEPEPKAAHPVNDAPADPEPDEEPSSNEGMALEQCRDRLREVLSGDTTGKKTDAVQALLTQYNATQVRTLPPEALPELRALIKKIE